MKESQNIQHSKKLRFECSGSVSTLWPFVLGRFVAGVGGAGMTDLFSVLINGKCLVVSLRARWQADTEG